MYMQMNVRETEQQTMIAIRRQTIFVKYNYSGKPVMPTRKSLKNRLKHLWLFCTFSFMSLTILTSAETTSGGALQYPVPNATFTRMTNIVPKADVMRLIVSRASTPPMIDGKLNDSAWTPIAPYRLVDARQGSTLSFPTDLKVAYDEQCLYIAYHCFEKGQESLRKGSSKRDDGNIFQADCVETFLQPKGDGAPYFQIVGNTSGGILNAKWNKPNDRLHWDGTGIRIGGNMRFDDWALELAIPFSDLGVEPPHAGDTWRANFYRKEQPSGDLHAWSPCGDWFHNVYAFGILEFAGSEASGTANLVASRLLGRIVDDDGAPIAGLRLHCNGQSGRTNASGDFTFDNLLAEEAVLTLVSPRYEHVMGTVALMSPLTVIQPIRVKRIDPYKPSFTAPFGNGAVRWIESSIDQPPNMGEPSTEPAPNRLELLATPGEYETRAVAFFANRELLTPHAAVGALTGPAGTVPATAMEVLWTQRLLKRVCYIRPREDADFNWRFLWREAPECVQAGHLRQLAVTVNIPPETAPGLYTGKLHLSDAQGEIATLPVELTVAGFTLVKPANKRVGVYYRGSLPDDQVRRELKDIHEHGGNVLVWHEHILLSENKDGAIHYDTAPIRRAVALQKEAGFGPPFIVSPDPLRCASMAGLNVRMGSQFSQEVLASSRFREIFGKSINAIKQLETEMGAGEFVYTWMDEVMDGNQLETYIAFARIFREFCNNRIYITLNNRDQAVVDQIAPWVDIRNYQGQIVEAWLGQGHTFKELENELRNDGDEAWTYYNFGGIAPSDLARVSNGYCLWRSPFTAHTPWIYYCYGGNPFDDLDANLHDFAYAAPHPTKPEMVSSLEWECFREGYDDLRYLATLEDALAHVPAERQNAPAVQQARALRQAYWDADPRIEVAAATLAALDYDQRRRDIASAIETLQGLSKTSKEQ